MTNRTLCKSLVRTLYSWEIEEARSVFGNQLVYDRIRIHECTKWTNSISKFGTKLKQTTYHKVPNAVSLGNHCYFPINLPVQNVPANHPDHYKICWLIHELTHIWQFQRMGWWYLTKALYTQIRLGVSAYEFGGEKGLFHRYIEGWRLDTFNLEQQGDIARSYYERKSIGKDVRAWVPFIDEFHGHI
ncbi:hypothetical protein ACFLUC_00810 [Chloroflexota bacterium]